MKKVLLLILLGLFSGKGQAAVTLNSLGFNLSPANGGAQTLISWSVSGPLISSQATAVGTWGGIGALFNGAFDASSFVTSQTFTVSGAGSFTNLSDSTSVQVSTIEFGRFNSSTYIVLGWGGAPFLGDEKQVSYTAGLDSYTINVPFTSFVVGNYSSSDFRLQGGMNFTTAVVPEPSALSLLAVGLGGLAILRRRRS